MRTEVLHDKSAILIFLRKSADLHIYSIGDLDDFFWPKTTWYGIIENDVIQSIALGNIAILPDYRNQQIGFKLTSRLCNDLLKNVNLIGLNVKSDNIFAIKCYKKTGFGLWEILRNVLLKIHNKSFRKHKIENKRDIMRTES